MNRREFLKGLGAFVARVVQKRVPLVLHTQDIDEHSVIYQMNPELVDRSGLLQPRDKFPSHIVHRIDWNDFTITFPDDGRHIVYLWSPTYSEYEAQAVSGTEDDFRSTMCIWFDKDDPLASSRFYAVDEYGYTYALTFLDRWYAVAQNIAGYS